LRDWCGHQAVTTVQLARARRAHGRESSGVVHRLSHRLQVVLLQVTTGIRREA
jgi:hypothetical protein